MNGREENERERSVGVCILGKNIEIIEIIYTGGKDPNNQWAHAEYIENSVNK